jgi:hypothetical protein
MFTTGPRDDPNRLHWRRVSALPRCELWSVALLDINRDRRRRFVEAGLESIDDLIRARGGQLVGTSAPAHGLTLMKVEY